jgi:biotin transport system substrate-specific component
MSQTPSTASLAHATLAPATLAEAAFSGLGASKLMRNLALMVVGSLLLTISAKLAVPFYPVPVTMQTLAVLAIGMAYGWRLGAATVALYIFQGALGLPVFAAGGGLAYLAGPTAGYIAGFLVSALVVGALAEKGWDKSFAKTAFANIIGTAIIFGFGLAWLGTFLGYNATLLEKGLTPFLIGAALKIALATVLMPSLWKLISKLRG